MSLSLLTTAKELLYQGIHSSNLTACSHSLSRASAVRGDQGRCLSTAERAVELTDRAAPTHSTLVYSKAILAHIVPTGQAVSATQHRTVLTLLPQHVPHPEV